MKKLFTVLMVVVLTTTMSLAQDLTSKKGENYLPESGEWSIGFDATSTLDYFGNPFNSNASAPSLESPTGQYDDLSESDWYNKATFYGKKMIDDKTAWRGRMEFGFGNDREAVPVSSTYDEYTYTQINEIIDYDVNGNGIGIDRPNSIEVDVNSRTDKDFTETTNSEFNLALWLGKEWRRGSTRLQGVYGAEVGLGLSSSKTTYDYGLSAESMFRGGLDEGGVRTTELKNSGGFMVGAGAFLGFEYFIVPKISLGGEYGWGFMLSSFGKGSHTYETTTQEQGGDINWDNVNDNVSGAFDTQNTPDYFLTNTDTDDLDSHGNFSLANQIRGTIAVNFYF